MYVDPRWSASIGAFMWRDGITQASYQAKMQLKAI